MKVNLYYLCCQLNQNQRLNPTAQIRYALPNKLRYYFQQVYYKNISHMNDLTQSTLKQSTIFCPISSYHQRSYLEHQSVQVDSIPSTQYWLCLYELCWQSLIRRYSPNLHWWHCYIWSLVSTDCFAHSHYCHSSGLVHLNVRMCVYHLMILIGYVCRCQ